MYRACELKDQTYKKTRTLHFSGTKDGPFARQSTEWHKGITRILGDKGLAEVRMNCLVPNAKKFTFWKGRGDSLSVPYKWTPRVWVVKCC